MVVSYLNSGRVITLLAPVGGTSTGKGYVVGGLFVVAATSAGAGLPFEGYTSGVFSLPKVSTQAWAAGDPVFWDRTNARCTSDPNAGIFIGAAADPADNPSAAGWVRLAGAGSTSGASEIGGVTATLINKTGAPSVRGQIVSAGGTVDYGFITAPANGDMPIGTVLDADIADGGFVRVACGAIGPVLMKDGVAAVRGHVLFVSDVDGRADASASLPSSAQHFREVGHVVVAAAAGGVCMAMLHFN